MAWYTLVSLISDGRVKFLLEFIIVAIVLAGALIFIELLLIRKKRGKTVKVSGEFRVDKLKKYMDSDKSPREKLNFVNRIAKEYFKENYRTPLNASYSFLIVDFEKNKQEENVAFCKAMFVTNYFQNDLTDEQAKTLANLLMRIIIKKEKAEEVSNIPLFVEKIDRFFVKWINVFVKWRKVRVERRRKIKSEKQKKIEAERRRKIDVEKQIKIKSEKQRRVEAERQRKIEIERRKRIEAEEQRVKWLEKKRIVERNKDIEIIHKQEEHNAKDLEIIRRDEEVIRRQEKDNSKKLGGQERIGLVRDKILKAKEKKLAKRKIKELAKRQKILEKKKLLQAKVVGGENVKRERGVSRIKSFMGGVGKFFDRRRRAILEKEKIVERSRREVKDWVKKAIEQGRDRESVFALLNDGKRSQEGINLILSIYDDEVAEVTKKKDLKIIERREQVMDRLKFVEGKGEGIAERIVRREKARLEREGVYDGEF